MEGSNIDIGYICLSAVTAAVQDDQFLSSNTTSIFVVNYSSSSNNLDYFSTSTEAKKKLATTLHCDMLSVIKLRI